MLYAPQNTSKTPALKLPSNLKDCPKKRGCLNHLFHQIKEKANPSQLKRTFSLRKHPSPRKESPAQVEDRNSRPKRPSLCSLTNERLCTALSRSIHFYPEIIAPIGSSHNLHQVTEL